MSGITHSASPEPSADSGRGTSLIAAFSAVTLVCVMLFGAWQMTSASTQIDWAQLPQRGADLMDGTLTNALEKQLDKTLPARPQLIALSNALRYQLLGSGGDQVRVGRTGWLFLTEELRHDPDAQRHLSARMDLLGAAASALERKGVKLVIALVPDKARVHSRHLASGEVPRYNLDRYQDALSALQQRNVQVVDLLTPLRAAASREDVYYRSDTHWNQLGAQIAANTIAQEIRRTGLTLTPGTFSTERSAHLTPRPGDLIRLMGLENCPNFLRPVADSEWVMATRQTGAVAGSLFDETTISVVLTGTSYALRGNFHGFLQQALETPVLNTAREGGGFLQAATLYLADESFRTSKPAVLIWEVPERFLGLALSAEPDWLEKTGLHPQKASRASPRAVDKPAGR
ncbi:MAG: hypothetical protein K9K38_05990 [Rhodoferax sp.]|nr:hypothetical protein [Rhodoferax sp.]